MYHKESMGVSKEDLKSLIGASNELGAASIIVTMITMIIISLIVIGFATISRRIQQASVNTQLSTQAFYAAESGVEDARKVILSALSAGNTVPGKTSCNTNTDGPGYSPNYPAPGGPVQLGPSANNVSYTCLLVNPTPTTLYYTGVSENQSIIVPVSSIGGSLPSPINAIHVTWSPTTSVVGNPATICPNTTVNSFKPEPNWTCDYGLLDVSMAPTDVSPLTRVYLNTNSIHSFFEPFGNSQVGKFSYAGNYRGFANKPLVTPANCGTSSYTSCEVDIENLQASGNLNSRSFVLRISSLYRPSNITITAYTTWGAQIAFGNSQALIDATGNANGVLRRIQVRLPISKYANAPSYSLESNGGVCKRFLVTPGYFNIPGNFPTSRPDSANNPMCSITSSGSPQPGG